MSLSTAAVADILLPFASLLLLESLLLPVSLLMLFVVFSVTNVSTGSGDPVVARVSVVAGVPIASIFHAVDGVPLSCCCSWSCSYCCTKNQTCWITALGLLFLVLSGYRAGELEPLLAIKYRIMAQSIALSDIEPTKKLLHGGKYTLTALCVK